MSVPVKVGDIVEFETAYSNPSRPRWDYSLDLGATDLWECASVVEVSADDEYFRVVLNTDAPTLDRPDDWTFDFQHIADGRVRVVDDSGEVSAPSVVVHFEPIPAHNGHVPDSVLATLVDRGERAVRRRLREWPYGKSLTHTWVLLPDGSERIEWRFV